jgi:hypothetical protein
MSAMAVVVLIARARPMNALQLDRVVLLNLDFISSFVGLFGAYIVKI